MELDCRNMRFSWTDFAQELETNTSREISYASMEQLQEKAKQHIDGFHILGKVEKEKVEEWTGWEEPWLVYAAGCLGKVVFVVEEGLVLPKKRKNPRKERRYERKEMLPCRG